MTHFRDFDCSLFISIHDTSLLNEILIIDGGLRRTIMWKGQWDRMRNRCRFTPSNEVVKRVR